MLFILHLLFDPPPENSNDFAVDFPKKSEAIKNRVFFFKKMHKIQSISKGI